MLPSEITEVTATTTTTSAAQTSNATLGQEDFLRMLIAQLENQDPLNPQQATEFTAQLAQFSSLEQLLAMRNAIEELTGSESTGQALAATSLIDKQVVAETGQFDLGSEGVPRLSFDLESNATSVRIQLIDANGRVIGDLESSALGQGRHGIQWDGLDRNGIRPPPGVYSFRVDALADGAPVTAREFVEGRVTGTTLGDGEPVLLMGSVVVPMTKVREVRSTGDYPGSGV